MLKQINVSPKIQKVLIIASITGMVLLIGLSAYLYFGGYFQRRVGTVQQAPSEPIAYDLPAFSTLSDLLSEGGYALGPDQLAFINGTLAEPSSLLTQNAIVEIKTLRFLTLEVNGVAQEWQTFEPTVRAVLTEVGLTIGENDLIVPPVDTPISDKLAISVRSAQQVTININGTIIEAASPAVTTAGILADLGISLLGGDQIETKIMEDGKKLITINRLEETIVLNVDYAPFGVKQEFSPDLAYGESEVKQPGQPGITMSNTRDMTFADGSKNIVTTEPQTVGQPVDQIILVSNQPGSFSLSTDAGDLTYWKVLEMYTTSYSPCNSGTEKCLYGTSSGLPAGYGVVAVTPSVFNALNGTQVYIPGYGIAVIGDVGGGFPDGRPWIDLGFDDSNYTSWSGYHTVYFLGSAPAIDPF